MFKQLKRSKGQLFLLLHSSQLHIERTIKEKFAVPCKIRNRPWCHYYLDYYYYGVILLQLLLGLLLWCYLASWFLRSKSIYMQKGHNSQAICTTKMKIGFCLTDSMSAPIMFKLQSHRLASLWSLLFCTCFISSPLSAPILLHNPSIVTTKTNK